MLPAQGPGTPSGVVWSSSLLYALKDRGKSRGIATLCIGGGEAVALGVELA